MARITKAPPSQTLPFRAPDARLPTSLGAAEAGRLAVPTALAGPRNTPSSSVHCQALSDVAFPAGFSPLRLFGWLLSDLLCIYEPPFLLFRFMTLAELDKLCEQRASSVQRSLLLTVGGLLPAC